MLNPRILAPALLLFAETACTRWQVMPAPEAVALVADSAPQLVRVTFIDGRRIEVDQPRIENNALTGLVRYTGQPVERVAIPLDSIARISRQRSDPSRVKAGVIVAVFGALGLVAWGLILD